jgi:SAM-dependent methyltransferase
MPGEVPERHNNWDRYGLPADMTGKTFLDVGCWEGVNCAEATRRGAAQVVGVDLCTSDPLRRNVEEFGFEFVQMDVLSEKWLELDDFDVVLCGGVLYHVENMISLLFRLRRVTAGLLFLETKVMDFAMKRPAAVFRPSDGEGNPSNWWFPNELGLMEMLNTCGFVDLEKTWENTGGGGHRVCVRGTAARQGNYNRALPRQAKRMPLEGGIRPGSVPDAELVASRAEAGPAAESEASPNPAS